MSDSERYVSQTETEDSSFSSRAMSLAFLLERLICRTTIVRYANVVPCCKAYITDELVGAKFGRCLRTNFIASYFPLFVIPDRETCAWIFLQCETYLCNCAIQALRKHNIFLFSHWKPCFLNSTWMITESAKFL